MLMKLFNFFFSLQAEEIKLATQQKDTLAIRQSAPKFKARKITDEEHKFGAHAMLRKVRADAAMWGIREKKAKEKAEAEKNK